MDSVRNDPASDCVFSPRAFLDTAMKKNSVSGEISEIVIECFSTSVAYSMVNCVNASLLVPKATCDVAGTSVFQVIFADVGRTATTETSESFATGSGGGAGFGGGGIF